MKRLAWSAAIAGVLVFAGQSWAQTPGTPTSPPNAAPGAPAAAKPTSAPAPGASSATAAAPAKTPPKKVVHRTYRGAGTDYVANQLNAAELGRLLPARPVQPAYYPAPAYYYPPPPPLYYPPPPPPYWYPRPYWRRYWYPWAY